MPNTCAVYSCPNKSGKGNKSVKYHRFPKTLEMQKLWIIACKRGNSYINPSSARVCSNHFTEKDYARNMKSEMLGILPKRKLLKGDAVPHRNLTHKNETKPKFLKKKSADVFASLGENKLCEQHWDCDENCIGRQKKLVNGSKTSNTRNKKKQKLAKTKSVHAQLENDVKYEPLELDDIEKPNKWWTLSKSDEGHIFCIKLDANCFYERHVVVCKDYSIKIFLNNQKIKLENGSKILNAQNLSLLLKAVDELAV